MPPSDAWKTISTKIAYSGQFLQVRSDQVLRSDGTQGTYEYIDKEDFVVILPRHQQGFYLVEQYRYAVGARSWEFPQGGCERERCLKDCARRELEEELGLRARKIVSIGILWLAVGNSNQSFEVYIAEDFEDVPANLEVSESDLVWRKFSDEEIRDMVLKGVIRSSTTLAALTLFTLNHYQ